MMTKINDSEFIESVQMTLPKESATFSSCRFSFLEGFLIPNLHYVAANIWTKERFEKFLDNAKQLAQGDPNLTITEV